MVTVKETLDLRKLFKSPSLPSTLEPIKDSNRKNKGKQPNTKLKHITLERLDDENDEDKLNKRLSRIELKLDRHQSMSVPDVEEKFGTLKKEMAEKTEHVEVNWATGLRQTRQEIGGVEAQIEILRNRIKLLTGCACCACCIAIPGVAALILYLISSTG